MSSPAGAGKTSLSRRLVADYADMILSISATTRPPRPGEEEGREYYFKTRAEFDAMVAAGGGAGLGGAAETGRRARARRKAASTTSRPGPSSTPWSRRANCSNGRKSTAIATARPRRR